MESNQTEFEDKYVELELLGRGNYGSAYIVQSNFNGKLFVAKKMNLDGMSEADIQAAEGQIQILKKFSDTNQYPFIVKYVECFMFDKTLVIVMEFCEHGDLAGFLKHAKKKGEPVDQKIILAWLMMLIMGIQNLHSKNVLHRDLKSANIFLTSNKYVKIGDFGISKVLDTTSAKTFIGTPYYLSPEVCSNKKYDFRSDLWSLGCILYELCTFDYPFQATNILSLAMKITSEEVKPIPSHYSKQLNNIVMGLLTKDENKRITLEQIMNTQYLKKFMQQHGNQIDKICQAVPIKKITKIESKLDGTIRKSANTAQDTMKTIQSNFQMSTKSNSFSGTTTNNDSLNLSITNEMSPKQQMKMRKQQRIRKEQLERTQAAKNSLKDRKFAKSLKEEQLTGTTNNLRGQMYKEIQQSNKKRAEELNKTKMGLGDNQAINLRELSELTCKMSHLGHLTDSQLHETMKNDSQMKHYVQPIKEQPSNISKQQQEEELDQYYDEDFEAYEPEQDDTAKKELQDVKVFFQVLTGDDAGISPSKKQTVEKAFEKQEIGPRTDQQRMRDSIKECIDIVGEQKYKLLYEMISDCYKGGQFKQSNQLKLLRIQGSRSEKHCLRLMEQIKYYEEILG